MSTGRWRLARNIAIVVAIVVLVVQLTFIVPLFADLIQRLPTDGNIEAEAPDPRNASRMRSAMSLQPLFIVSALAAIFAWWKAKNFSNSDPNKPRIP